MRILTVCHNLQRGGTQRVAQNFSLEFHRRGHETAVLALDGGGVRQAPLEEAGLPVFVGGPDAELDAAIDRALDFRPEIIQFHRPGMTNEAESRVLKRLAADDRRIIETSHFGRADPSDAAGCFAMHLQLSEWCLWRWRRWVGSGDDSPVGVVVNNPVDIERFSPAPAEAVDAYRREKLGLPDGAFLCGRVGQSNRGKWHPAILSAFEQLAASRPNAWLAMIGVSDEAREAVAALPEGVRDRVIELPLIDDDAELACFYSAMDVFLHAARIGETFGLVLTEAMLCGTPPVTLATPHRDNSQPEVVEHGVGGLVALSPGDLGAALCQAYDDSEQLGRLAAACRGRVIDRYASGSTAERVLELFQMALDCRSRSELRARLAERDDFVSSVPDARILELLKNGVGKTSMKEKLLMRLVTQPTLYRGYRRLRRAARR